MLRLRKKPSTKRSAEDHRFFSTSSPPPSTGGDVAWRDGASAAPSLLAFRRPLLIEAGFGQDGMPSPTRR